MTSPEKEYFRRRRNRALARVLLYIYVPAAFMFAGSFVIVGVASKNVKNHWSVYLAAVPLLILAFALGLRGTRMLTGAVQPRVQVVLGGLPGVGKTVYANVFHAVMVEGNSQRLQYTADSRTAQAVYASIAKLAKGEWPSSTVGGAFELFRGTVEFRLTERGKRIVHAVPGIGRLNEMIYGARLFDLILADSAGEHWRRMAASSDTGLSEDAMSASLIKDTAESEGLVYLIDAQSVFSRDEGVRSAVDDLLGTVSQLKAIAGVDGHLRPAIAVVLSKVDLLTPSQRDRLSRWLGETRKSDPEVVDESSDLAVKSIRGGNEFVQLERLRRTLDDSHPGSAAFFLATSLGAAVEASLLTSEQARGLIRVGAAKKTPTFRPDEAERLVTPVRWILRKVRQE